MNQLDRIANELALQRNDALNKLAVSSALVQEKTEIVEAAFKTLQVCMKDQTQEVVDRIQAVPGFVEWNKRGD